MTATALIVTLQMDPSAAEFFTGLRQTWFPPERNWLDAHITLFHALPLASIDTVLRDVEQAAVGRPAFRLSVERIHFLGAGVAYALSSDEALALRTGLSSRWSSLLGRQDRNWHGPLHITVQNKVSSQEARQLATALERDFRPWSIGATGLQVWKYLGGPWRLVATFAFSEPQAG